MLRFRFRNPLSILSSSPRLPLADPSIRSHAFIRNPIVSPFRQMMRAIKTFVWWDLHCSVTEDDLCAVFNRIGSALEIRGMEPPIWVQAYANFTKDVSISAQEALVSSGVHLLHVPECESTKCLLQKDMMRWLSYNSPPAHIVLITNDGSFASIIQHLTRLKYTVILSCDIARKRKLLCKASTFMWPWQPLAKGLAFNSMQFNELPDTVYHIRDANRAIDHRKALNHIFQVKPVAKTKTCNATLCEGQSPTDETNMEPLMFEGDLKYCRTNEEVDRAILELNEKLRKSGIQEIPLGFDTEWKPYGRGEPSNKTAVIQIQTWEEFDKCCFVLHIINSGIPSSLKSMLESRSYLKVGMSISTDADKLAKDYNLQVHPMIDIGELAAAKFTKPVQKWGLSSLSALVLKRKLEKPKEIRTSNWELDVLTEEQIMYAAKDAYASLNVYQVLNSMPNLPNKES